MSQLFDTIQHKLTADVADAATFAVSIPTGRTAGEYLSYDHQMTYGGAILTAPAGFTVSISGTTATVTNASGTTWASGEEVFLTLFRSGDPDAVVQNDSAARLGLFKIELGSPAAADADGVCASQAGTADTAMTIAGALATGGVATFDVPRNVVAAWTNTAVLTVTGTDEYGATVVEASGSGTSMAGKKAFKTITSVVPSANITGATVGTGDVLGLPLFIPNAASLIAEAEDGAAPTAGTLVAGVVAEATATTGDVRGTYDPDSNCDGSATFELIVALDDPDERGVAQYAG